MDWTYYMNVLCYMAKKNLGCSPADSKIRIFSWNICVGPVSSQKSCKVKRETKENSWRCDIRRNYPTISGAKKICSRWQSKEDSQPYFLKARKSKKGIVPWSLQKKNVVLLRHLYFSRKGNSHQTSDLVAS